MNSKYELIELARLYANDFKLKDGSPLHFLLALMSVESSLGRNNVPRFELSYSRLSIAYKKSELLKEGHKQWGDLAAMSYGPAQILWIVARELGYQGHPLDLWHGVNSMPWVIKVINRNIEKGADTLDRLAASYNAGLGALKNPDLWPSRYLQKFRLAYDEMKATYK